MKSELAWSTVVLSNVLLTIPVTFTFMVLGWVGGGLIADQIISNPGLVPGVYADNETIRLVLTACMALAGFVVSQVCFVVRYLERGDRPWRLMPFHFRFSLGSILAVSLATAALLWLNISGEVSKTSIEITTYRGWPNGWMHVTVQKIADFSGPITPLPPPTISFNWVIGLFNAAVCLDLMLIALVIAEVFVSRRERESRPGETRPASMPALAPSRSDPA